MALEIFREPLIGKYDGVTNPVAMPVGGISDGKNVRKISQHGGWKPRKGNTFHDPDPVDSTNDVDSLHIYDHPRTSDYYLISQCNSLLYESNGDPPTAGTTYTSLGLAVGTTPGFSTMVGEDWFYADGSARPVTYGGSAPYPLAVMSYDNSATAYVDWTKETTDNRTDTEAIILGASSDQFIIVTKEIAEAFAFVLGSTVNTDAATATLKAWRSGAWAAVTSFNDTTDVVATKTLSGAGSMSWTKGADEMRMVENVLGYAYQITFSGALSNSVDVISVTCTQDASLLTNKWNGSWDFVTGALFFDVSAGSGSVGIYSEHLGDITNESTSQYMEVSEMQTGDFIIVKTPELATAFGFGIVRDYGNLSSSLINNIDWWDGDSWTTVSTNIVDTTLDTGNTDSLSQTGKVSFDASALSTPRKRTYEGDPVPGYWWRISCAAALSTDVRIFAILYAAHPEPLPAYDGCVEFKGRLFLWGDPEFPNKLRYSAEGRPDCFSGSDSGYTRVFGDSGKIVFAIKFYNELLVFKEPGRGIFLLEGYNPATFGSLRIADVRGLASPKAADVVEVGYPGMHSDEGMSICIWQDTDGIYALDGRKPKKISGEVDHYFNTEYSTAIAAASIANRQSFTDHLRNEWHLILPAGELVYNYLFEEWFPPWARAVSLKTGLGFRGSDNRFYTYGGDAAGRIHRLENDTSDKNAANADVAIDHSIKTRAMGVSDQVQEFRVKTLEEFDHRHIWAELTSQTAGAVTATHFKDMADTGTAITATMSLIKSGYGIVVAHLDVSVEACRSIQYQFRLNTIDAEMEIFSILWGGERRRLPQ